GGTPARRGGPEGARGEATGPGQWRQDGRGARLGGAGGYRMSRYDRPPTPPPIAAPRSPVLVALLSLRLLDPPGRVGARPGTALVAIAAVRGWRVGSLRLTGGLSGRDVRTRLGHRPKDGLSAAVGDLGRRTRPLLTVEVGLELGTDHGLPGGSHR